MQKIEVEMTFICTDKLNLEPEEIKGLIEKNYGSVEVTMKKFRITPIDLI